MTEEGTEPVKEEPSNEARSLGFDNREKKKKNHRELERAIGTKGK